MSKKVEMDSNSIPYYSKYHRTYPIRSFSPEQTMYSLVKSINKDNMTQICSSCGARKITYAQLIENADRLAEALFAEGIKEGDLIGIMLLTVPEVASTLLGLNKLGAVSFWMDVRTKPEHIVEYINTYNMRAVIILDILLPLFRQIIDMTSLSKVVVVSAAEFVSEDARFVGFNELLRSVSTITLAPVPYVKNNAAVIIQSSGSTGKAKAIVHSNFNLNTEIEKMAYVDIPLLPKLRCLAIAPPWVVYGLVNSIYSCLVFGQEVIFTVEPREDIIFSHLGCFDLVYGVPVYYRWLYTYMSGLNPTDASDLSELERIRACLQTVRVFITGGDKATEDELLAWQHCFNVPMVNGYGNNELVGAAIVSPLYANRPDSIGIPMYGTLARTYSEETDSLLPEGELGELCLCSSSVFIEYLGMPEETQQIKREHEGMLWVHTGDLAYIDREHFVYLRGRSRRLIIDKMGYKISPDTSEKLIQSANTVEECVVVGVDLGDNDRVPFAFVELKKEFKNCQQFIDQLAGLCHSNLKDYECPRFFYEIDKIPHKANGGKQDFLQLETMAAELVGKL